jgi:hypothetical protein
LLLLLLVFNLLLLFLLHKAAKEAVHLIIGNKIIVRGDFPFFLNESSTLFGIFFIDKVNFRVVALTLL